MGLFSLLILSFSAQASPSKKTDLEGSISARTIAAPPDSRAQLVAFSGFHAYAAVDVPMSLPWSLTAESVTVNLTHRQWKEWVQSPSSPEAMMVGGPKNLTYRQFNVEQATMAGDTQYSRSNLLVEPRSGDGNASLVLPAQSRWQTGADEPWWGGSHYPGWQAVGDNPLAHFFSPPDNVPVAASTALGPSQIKGNFVVYGWGSNVTLNGAGRSSETIRTGLWHHDDVGLPNGFAVQRNVHAQLLRLEAQNASLDLEVVGGSVRWASHEAALDIHGSLKFQDAAVDLTSANHVYHASQASVTLGGAINATIRSTGPGGPLDALIHARDAQLSMPPTADRTPPSPSPQDALAPAPGPLAASGPSAPKASEGTQAPFWIAAVAVAGVSGVALLSRRIRERNEADRLLDRAERALVNGDARSCEQWVEQALQFEPRNGRAWFLAGASLLKQGQHDRAARLLDDILNRVEKEAASLAYLLSLCLHRAGRGDEAKRWLGLVARDPKLWDSLGQETDFDLVLRRILGASRADVAYS